MINDHTLKGSKREKEVMSRDIDVDIKMDDRPLNNDPEKARQKSKGLENKGPETINLRLERLEALAKLMDVRLQIPGTGIRLGLDALVGLIPVAGDTVNMGVSAYIIFEAGRLGARKRDIIKMAANMGIDWLIGMVPLIGDIFDIGWKANMRNVGILKKSLKKQKLISDKA